MAVKETGFQWTCDWCEKTETTYIDKGIPPEDWIEVPQGALYVMEMEHLCGESCWRAARHADILAHELSKHVVRMVRRHWKAAKIEDIPDGAHVDLAFVIDGKVIEVEG